MRKIASLRAVLIQSFVLALSQTKNVTARVTDSNVDPPPSSTAKGSTLEKAFFGVLTAEVFAAIAAKLAETAVFHTI